MGKKKSIGIRIDEEILEEVDFIAQLRGWSRSRTIQEIIEDYIIRNKIKNQCLEKVEGEQVIVYTECGKV